MNQDTPSLTRAVQSAINAALSNVHTALPGVIASYNSAKQIADVQPNLKRVTFDGQKIQLPIIPNVPVVFPRSSDAFISFPLKPGDQVLLIVIERSIERWLESGGLVAPGDVRKFNLSDAVCIPGFYPSAETVTADPNNLVVQNDQARVEVFPDGKFSIKSLSSGKELLTILTQLVQGIIDAKVNTLLGPQPLVPPTPFITALADLNTLKGD
jgi:hypothetical protein